MPVTASLGSQRVPARSKRCGASAMDKMSMLSQVSRVNLSIPLSLKASLIGAQRIAEFTLRGQADILSPTMQEH